MSLIALHDVHLSFQTKKIFKGFDLTVEKDSKILIKGVSGSGKSSLLKLILGFIRPKKGHIYFEGELIDKNNIWKIRKSIAYVSQDMSLGNGPVKDFFSDIFSYQANKSKTGWKNDVQNLFNEFLLNENIYESKLAELSGGEQQRIAIIAAIALNRPLYLLDEITSALDDKLKKVIAEYFMGLADKTIIVVSHDPVWESYNMKAIRLNEK